MEILAHYPDGKASGSGPQFKPGLSAGRIISLDVYRGFVMLLMMGEVLSFSHVSESIPKSSFWRFLYFNQDHVQWFGCSLHDMIQPSFTFLVGVALPFSIAKRLQKGEHFKSLLLHAIKRSLILIALGIFLRSTSSNQTYFTFEDTLTQIGLGYAFLFFLGFCSQRVQIISLVVIVVGYWLAFAIYPLPPATLGYASTGVPEHWAYNFHGFAAHWNKNTNLAWAVDRWFLNLFPRESPFRYNEGGYATLSFIPTLGTMILGLLAGNAIKNDEDNKRKLKVFIITGLSLAVVSLIFHYAGVSPIVKRIWTPGWVVFSGGICFLMLAFFYGVVDVAGKKRWSFFLMVIGSNSIAAYFIADGGVRSFISRSLHTHLGQNYDHLFGAEYSTLINGTLVLLIIWLTLYWLYKRKIFIRI